MQPLIHSFIQLAFHLFKLKFKNVCWWLYFEFSVIASKSTKLSLVTNKAMCIFFQTKRPATNGFITFAWPEIFIACFCKCFKTIESNILNVVSEFYFNNHRHVDGRKSKSNSANRGNGFEVQNGKSEFLTEVGKKYWGIIFKTAALITEISSFIVIFSLRARWKKLKQSTEGKIIPKNDKNPKIA